MRSLTSFAIPLFVVACGGASAGGGPSDSAETHAASTDGLTRCFDGAYDDADREAAFAKCEQKYFGTEWRKDASRAPAQSRDGTIAANTGHLDPVLVQAAVNARMHRMRACYHNALAKDPSLRIDMRVEVQVASNGHPMAVEEKGGRQRDKQVVACILGEFKALQFPHPEGGIATVTYPLVIAPGDR
jgi:hypothetical protein